MEVREERPFIIRHFTSITRIVGLFTSTALWWTGVFLADKDDKRIAAYLMICGFAVSFFEITFILNKCVCCKEESCGYQLWKYILAVDNWKKSLLYTCLSVVCYLHPKEFWQALISGVLLDLTALLYLIRTFRTGNASEPYKYKQLEIR
ncbi:transmembrane protein 72-like [Orbicella faveolata]|uniref:transmembrane protein 72-like n=1 Tax=Orbicella faveolata TaxID=48498 RepID=UPI0009E573BB|nr:transmembrane protein 72-like [Orbicella faveolata]